MPITVLLADDHAVIREGLRMLLERTPDLRVVDAVADGGAAVEAAARLRPDIAVLDIAMPGLDGIEAARRIREQSPQTRIVMLSMHDSAEHMRRAASAGASGYLSKDAAAHELASALRRVHAGQRHFPGAPARPAEGAAPRAGLDSLSRREREVLRLVADGRSNGQVAEQLLLSVKTVETYRSRAMQKLGLRNLAELVKFAVSHGFTSLD